MRRGVRAFLAAHAGGARRRGEFGSSYALLAASGGVLGVRLTTTGGTATGSGTTTAAYPRDGLAPEAPPARRGPGGEVAAPPAVRQRVVVPRAAAEPQLSAFGRRVRHKAMHSRDEYGGRTPILEACAEPSPTTRS